MNNLTQKTVILCGGLGTRLRSVVADRPKSMALISGLPYLERLLAYASSLGLKKFLLLTGYRADQIETHFNDGEKWGIEIEYSREEQPLGTGGAVLLAAAKLTDPFFLLNGDSYAPFDPQAMLACMTKEQRDLVITTVQVENASRYGTLELDSLSQVQSFHEKTGLPNSGWINAGIYLLRPSLFAGRHPGDSFSLEREIITPLPAGSIRAIQSPGPFIDIGLPEDLERAQHFPFSR